ncbi:MAG TPA: CPXCG motif-containing cysteine-rich protein [Thermoanaerobaculia bacterium]|nr:CPXCG motif-containing cysteine-rich protein [Thermoanaerobaculia bacterium]
MQDCEVCCNPWQVTVTRDRDGDADVRVERLD